MRVLILKGPLVKAFGRSRCAFARGVWRLRNGEPVALRAQSGV